MNKNGANENCTVQFPVVMGDGGGGGGVHYPLQTLPILFENHSASSVPQTSQMLTLLFNYPF